MNKHNSLLLCGCRVVKSCPTACTTCMKQGGLAQMVERPLSMREVPGSIPGFSKLTIILFLFVRKLYLILGTFE